MEEGEGGWMVWVIVVAVGQEEVAVRIFSAADPRFPSLFGSRSCVHFWWRFWWGVWALVAMEVVEEEGILERCVGFFSWMLMGGFSRERFLTVGFWGVSAGRVRVVVVVVGVVGRMIEGVVRGEVAEMEGPDADNAASIFSSSMAFCVVLLFRLLLVLPLLLGTPSLSQRLTRSDSFDSWRSRRDTAVSHPHRWSPAPPPSSPGPSPGGSPRLRNTMCVVCAGVLAVWRASASAVLALVVVLGGLGRVV